MHRAALMISMLGENDQNRGLDTKVIAVQSYTQALQELSGCLDEAEKSLDILTAVLVLMAYFEVRAVFETNAELCQLIFIANMEL
jgi:hypothetical protein